MLGVCLVLRPQASGQVTSRTGEQSDLRPIDPGLCRRQRGWQRFKYKASAASYSAPTLLEPMETAVVDICLGDREKWVGREGGHSISTEVTQPVVALVTYLLGREIGVGVG